MVDSSDIEYLYDTSELNHSHGYLLPSVVDIVKKHKPKKMFELGCGNGSIANSLSALTTVEGIDLSESAIEQANLAYPNLNLQVGSVYDDLAEKFGQYSLVTSLEVVEHVFDPRAYAKTLYNLVDTGGHAVVSTPYHGYWKNLALAVTGKMDDHFTVLWDGGHIKFWSIATLTTLLSEAGFKNIQFRRVGRFAPIAKSMIAICEK